MALLDALNDKQRKAATIIDGPVLILAGAGSGKTMTLTHRIAYMVEKGIPAQNILAVTFTNKAAKEMSERVRRLLRGRSLIIPIMGTFHSVCVKILRREIENLGYKRSFVIFDSSDQQTLIKKAIKDLGYDTKKVSPNGVHGIISRNKNHMITAEGFSEMAGSFIEEIAAKVFIKYDAELKEHNALDFDDLLLKTVELWTKHPDILKKYQNAFRYVLVDEYQDTNQVQYTLLKMLTAEHRNLCVVGDDWQSIYAFRGANVQNILNFEKDFKDTRVILLEQNYRSTGNIVAASNHIIRKKQKQKDKKLWTIEAAGEKIGVFQARDEKDEADWVARKMIGLPTAAEESLPDDGELTYVSEETSILDRVMNTKSFQDRRAVQKMSEDVARKIRSGEINFAQYVILYRTNAQSRAVEETMIHHGIPYKLIGGIRFYERREIKDMLAYLRILANPNDWVSMERIVNVPPRGIGARSWLKIEQFCREQGLLFTEAAKREIPGVMTKSWLALKEFAEDWEDVMVKAETLNPVEILDMVAKLTGYKDMLIDGSEEGEMRWENIQELKTVMGKFSGKTGVEGLLAFLEETSLVADTDDIDETTNAVTMMTVHAAKGLEFPEVFVIGCEEGLFPHSRSLLSPEEMEEERRLFYVAVTRAKKRLHLLFTAQRTIYGATQVNEPSRFLADIPEQLKHEKQTAKNLW
ncbi:MAG: hypothetical protein A3F54_03845 [Candidatus Kerfeldbacteria bacterium RIFCSPHIGHO2_12_FULL_48_17]|uniref:DNA 3'-5' helicase n=1 Tax=Candidatus Kerfeldbacteria bacterium RIFCSPHIGHO2_12_FULL_48_17 TaxID=1798542 RepID=A0A1G2B536_9BACT|nr:MAG: hypothetical protein A3F54_03845 [Candidatus Kerfeldbacteria bacterium RIFCSPHIGHO2_12_FULL_48_17]